MLFSNSHSAETRGGRGGLLRMFPRATVLLFILVVLLELEESIQRVPTIRLLENAICMKHFQNISFESPINEQMCKENSIQMRLAFVRGWLSFFDSLPLIIFGPVSGSIADKNGRRIAFSLSVLGTLCAMGFIFLICSLWNYLPVEFAWISSLFRIVGGGPAFAIAMCLTMASDISNEAERSNTFYRVYSAVLITDLIGPPIAYGTLQHSLWLPYAVAALFLCLTFPVVYFIPETLHQTHHTGEEHMRVWELAGIQRYVQFLSDWRILCGVITVFLAQFRANTIEILLPYTSVRFGMTLAEVGALLPIVSAINIVVFLVLLPALSKFLQKRARWSTTSINIFVARMSCAFLVIGSGILAIAPSIKILVTALIVYAAGLGIRLSILAALTSFVNSAKETARLYTMISTTDSIAHMIASPLLQQVWRVGLRLGGGWLVLPFIVLMGIFTTAFFTSCLVNEKLSTPECEDTAGEVRQPLLPSDRQINTNE